MFTKQEINLSPAGVSEKTYKKWFLLDRKSISTTQNEAFVEKYISTIHKICFFWQENQRKLFPLAGKYFSFKITSPVGLQQKKKSSEQKHTVFARQKISLY